MIREAKHNGADAHASKPSTVSLSTPYQVRQNGEATNGVGSMHPLTTPSLGGRLHQSLEASNSIHSSPGGISPTKFSPQVSAATAMGEAARAKLTLSPMTNLDPAPTPQDPTPPVKSLDIRSSFSSFGHNFKDG